MQLISINRLESRVERRAFKSPTCRACSCRARYQSRVTILREAKAEKQEGKRIAESYEIRREGTRKGEWEDVISVARRLGGKVTRNRIYWRRRGSAGEFFRVSPRPAWPFDSPVNHDSSRGISQNGAASAREGAARAGLGIRALR